MCVLIEQVTPPPLLLPLALFVTLLVSHVQGQQSQFERYTTSRQRHQRLSVLRVAKVNSKPGKPGEMQKYANETLSSKLTINYRETGGSRAMKERGSPHKYTLHRTHNASEIQIVKLELALSANKSYVERGVEWGVVKGGSVSMQIQTKVRSTATVNPIPSIAQA